MVVIRWFSLALGEGCVVVRQIDGGSVDVVFPRNSRDSRSWNPRSRGIEMEGFSLTARVAVIELPSGRRAVRVRLVLVWIGFCVLAPGFTDWM